MVESDRVKSGWVVSGKEEVSRFGRVGSGRVRFELSQVSRVMSDLSGFESGFVGSDLIGRAKSARI